MFRIMFPLVVGFLSMTSYGEVPASCFRPRTSLSCEFYSDCMEKQFQCGSQGYPLQYGQKYCERFKSLNTSNSYSRFTLSPEGVNWRNETLKCLQNVLIPSLTMVSLVSNCDAVERFAFASHPKCYTQPGSSICDIPKKDWLLIMTVPDLNDSIFSTKGTEQFKSILLTCGSKLISDLDKFQSRRAQAERVNYFKSDNNSVNEEAEIYEKLEFLESIKRERNQNKEI